MVVMPMHDKGLAADKIVYDNQPEEGKRYYAKASRLRFETHNKMLKHDVPPEHVAQTISKIFFAWEPKVCYLVGTDTRIILALNKLLPQSWMGRLIASLVRLSYALQSVSCPRN